MTPNSPWTLAETRGRAGLLALEGDWRRLWARMPLRTSFTAFETLLAHVDHILPDPDGLRCLALSGGGRVRAICLLEPRPDRRLGLPVPVWAVLRPRHGPQADLVCADDEARRAFLPAMLDHLRRHPLGRRLLVLGPLPEASALWDGLDAEPCLDPQESVRTLPCDRPYAELLMELSGQFRHNLKTARKRLDALEGVRFVVAREPADLAAEFTTFLDVEARSWKGGAGTALKFRGNLPLVLADLARNLRGEAGHCEILAIYAEGRCLASAIGSRTGAVYSGLKICYDPAYHRLSPGQQLLARVVERCCADPEVRVLDLVSPAPWVRGWRTEAVPLRLAYLNIGGWRGAALVALLRLRLGPLRLLASRGRAAWSRMTTRLAALRQVPEPRT